MIECGTLLKSYLTYSDAHLECERVGEHLLVRTPFAYYDGDDIQVFVRELYDGSIEISDLGYAVQKLNLAGITVSGARSRESIVEGIRRSRGVDFDRGRFFAICRPEEFPEYMLRLVQAMLQASDIIFSRRQPVIRTFSAEVEEILEQAALRYKRAIRLQGAYGNRVHEFDFQLELPILTVVKALSAVSTFGADDQTNRLLGAIVDVRARYERFHPIVFLDDSGIVSWQYAYGILSQQTEDVFHCPKDHDK